MRELPYSDPLVTRAIGERATAVLATINPDGSPLAVPMWFVLDDAGPVMVSVDGLRKVRNLRRDPRLSVVVETELPQIKCVIIQGRAEFLDEIGVRAGVGKLFVSKYGVEIEQRWAGSAVPSDRVLFRIVPKRIKLWG